MLIGLKNIKEIKEITDMLSSRLRDVVEEAYLFGSIVEGCGVAEESDLDLLIVLGDKSKR